MVPRKIWSLIMVGLLMTPFVQAPRGVIAGLCYSGCSIMVALCFAFAGFSLGAVPKGSITTVPSLMRCNASFTKCQDGCMPGGVKSPDNVESQTKSGPKASEMWKVPSFPEAEV